MQMKQFLSPTFPVIVSKLSTILRVGPAIKQWKKIVRSNKDRYSRLNELVTSEAQYYKYLLILRDKLKYSLEKSNLISREQSIKLFPNIDGMIVLSGMIRDQFQAILPTWNSKSTTIGMQIMYYSQSLKIYTEFFNDFTQNLDQMKAIKTNNQNQFKKIQKMMQIKDSVDILYSKPFDRPMKYHLFLRQYHKHTSQEHPDYQPLKKAIEEYQKVMHQNNFLKESHQKNHTLKSLEAKFGNIISSEARFYIDLYEGAYWFDMPMSLYVFSDMVLIVHSKLGVKEFGRVYLNKYSHVETAHDFSFFKSRLYFYGANNCVHLTFQSVERRDEVAAIIKRLINQIDEKEMVREMTIMERLSKNSKSLKRKSSCTDLEPQLLRPINAEIVGMETRIYSSDDVRKYIVVQFYPAYSNSIKKYTPYNLSFIDQEILLQLQTALTKELYPGELKCQSILHLPKSMIIEQNDRISSLQKLQLKTIFSTLFLNSLFRNQQLSKRIDYIMYRLQLPQTFWKLMRINNNEDCTCRPCLQCPPISNYHAYFKQLSNRTFDKGLRDSKYKRSEFCELRTITAHEKFTRLPPELLSKAWTEQKIAWVKSTLGKINHTMTNTKPNSPWTEKTTILVTMPAYPHCYDYPIICNLKDRPQQIISKVVELRSQKTNEGKFNLDEYVLVAKINGDELVILDNDEPLMNCREKIKTPENIFQLLACYLVKNEVKNLQFFLEKYWVIYQERYYLNITSDKTRVAKLNYEVGAIMERISTEEIRLEEDDMLEFYAMFICKFYYEEYRTFTVGKVSQIIKKGHGMYFPTKMHEKKVIDKLFKKIEKYQEYKAIKVIRSQVDLAIRIVKKAAKTAGWSCFFISAEQQINQIEYKAVKIGCDLQGLKVRQKDSSSLLLDLKLDDDSWTYLTKGQSLIVTQGNNMFTFLGRQVWKVRKQIEFYHLYTKSFSSI